ncbi:MAG: thiol:disulfide interchange protein, partial [Flavobacteriales bacterium 32-34-25]
MKKLFFLLTAFLVFTNVNSQILDPVKWTTKIEQKSEGVFVLTFNAVIEKDWHMYSQFTPDGGPLAMEVIFKNQAGNFSLIGKAKESKTRTAYNDVFEVNETFFEGKAQIQQEIKLTNSKLNKVEVELNYQVCKEVCINQSKKFTFQIPAAKIAAVPVIKKDSIQEAVQNTKIADATKLDSIPTPSLGASNVVEAVEKTTLPETAETAPRSVWSIFFIAFLSGFAALLTPCVFPMIPMTVSFFTKQSKTRAKGIRNAIIYGVSIIVIYVILGILVTWIFGADALNALSTNVWFNLLFFVLLIVFAASFLGAFEIM